MAISGASAGAVNGVVAASGYLEGGAEGARVALRRLWTSVGQMSLLMTPLSVPGFDLHLDFLTRLVSPYQFNPLNINPLRDLLAEIVDFERLRTDGRIPLFLSATDVNTGAQRIFREQDVTLDVVMASCCLPSLCQAVEIDGQAYWDGGFSSNPPILPVVLQTSCRSLLLIKLSAEVEPETPTGASEITSRLRRILVNAPLLHDLEAMDLMQQQLRRTSLLPADLRRVRDLVIHTVAIEPEFFAASNGSALGPHPEFVAQLHQSGRAAAERLIADGSAAEAEAFSGALPA
jgi:NTE family protein